MIERRFLLGAFLFRLSCSIFLLNIQQTLYNNNNNDKKNQTLFKYTVNILLVTFFLMGGGRQHYRIFRVFHPI